jgi:hypothetical protein
MLKTANGSIPRIDVLDAGIDRALFAGKASSGRRL